MLYWWNNAYDRENYTIVLHIFNKKYLNNNLKSLISTLLRELPMGPGTPLTWVGRCNITNHHEWIYLFDGKNKMVYISHFSEHESKIRITSFLFCPKNSENTLWITVGTLKTGRVLGCLQNHRYGRPL